MATAKPFHIAEYPQSSPKNLHFSPASLAILSVGRDQEVLKLRERMIAGRSDLTVRSITPEQAEGYARDSRLRLWIFCSTVELPKLMYLASSIRRYSPNSRLLLLDRDQLPRFGLTLFHRAVCAFDKVDSLLEAVSQMANKLASPGDLKPAGYDC
jgi:hypothetical protein